MMADLVATVVADPLLVGAGLPLAIGFFGAAVLRFCIARQSGGLAMFAALAAFLLVHLLIEGVPSINAVSARQKLFWLAAAGGLAGAVAIATRSAAIERSLLVLLPAAGLLWLGERQWLRGPEFGFVLQLLLLWAAIASIGLRLRATNSAAQGFAGGAQLVVAAIALALIALIGASLSLATLAGALAAGLGGVLLFDYLVMLSGGSAVGLGPAGRLGVFAPLGFVAANLVLFVEEASMLAVALLVLVFLSGRLPLRFGGGETRAGRAVEPVRATLVALAPAVVAVGIALLQAELTAYP